METIIFRSTDDIRYCGGCVDWFDYCVCAGIFAHNTNNECLYQAKIIDCGYYILVCLKPNYNNSKASMIEQRLVITEIKKCDIWCYVNEYNLFSESPILSLNLSIENLMCLSGVILVDCVCSNENEFIEIFETIKI